MLKRSEKRFKATAESRSDFKPNCNETQQGWN